MLRPTVAALAVLTLFAGASVAAPTAQAPDRPAPAGDLPGAVPEFVDDVLETVGALLEGLLDGLTAGGSGDDTAPSGEQSPVTTTDAGGGETTTATATATTAAADGPYSLTVERVTECGQTCREVTTTLTNEQSATATGVTVTTKVYAGEGTDGELVWEGEWTVGEMAPGASVTTTERIDLSLTEAYAVKQQDGQVTIRTTVESDDRTVTFSEQRDVT